MIYEELLIRLVQIILVPHFVPDVIWSVAPLFFGLVMIQMYNGRYKTEDMGWNSAFGNSVSLMWAVAILIRYIYLSYGFEYAWRTPGLRGQMVLVIVLTLATFLLVVFNYKHSISKRWAYFLADSVPTTVLAYLAIVIVMGRIPVDRYTLVAGMVIYLVIDIVFRLYRKAISSPWYVERALEQRKKKAIKERKMKARNIKRKVAKVIPLSKKPKKSRKKRS